MQDKPLKCRNCIFSLFARSPAPPTLPSSNSVSQLRTFPLLFDPEHSKMCNKYNYPKPGLTAGGWLAAISSEIITRRVNRTKETNLPHVMVT